MTTLRIPDFNFTSFYYPQILESLMQYKRGNVPEHTDESQYDAFIQLLRAFALVGHLNNVLIDLVANESTLPTAKLTESVRNMLRLIDYEMSPASPASAEMVYELSKVFTSSAELIPEGSQVSNKRRGTEPIIIFESPSALVINRTDQITTCLVQESDVWTDRSTEINDTGLIGFFQPWATPAVGDEIYFGHDTVVWDQLQIFLKGSGAGYTGVWEWYDGNFLKTSPTSVADSGGYLTLDLTDYLGATNKTGTIVRVQYNLTGAYEDIASTWIGSTNVAVTTGYLGQTAPSTTPSDYTIGSDWEIFGTENSFTDGTNSLFISGSLQFALPKSLDFDWNKTSIQVNERYWIRFRIVTVGSPTSPLIYYASITQGKQYAIWPVVQGRTTIENLGSSTGVANQRFTVSRDYFIQDSETVRVDGTAWIQVRDFLSSYSTSNHYRIELGANDRATIVFGDGVLGKIPPVGVNNVAIEFRYGAEVNGNLGALTIVSDKSGLSYVNGLWNPRSAVGWSEAEGANPEALEIVKQRGPASLRTGAIAIGPGDLERKVIDYVDENGSSPFSRAKANEEGYGPKTVELIVVGKGGGTVSSSALAALELYFNGDQTASPPVPKQFIVNHEVVVTNFSPHPIDITATVYVSGFVTSESIENQLILKFQPEALKDDGVTWEWNFGEDVPLSRILHEIHNASEGINRVVLVTPSTDTSILDRELPTIGTITLTLVQE